MKVATASLISLVLFLCSCELKVDTKKSQGAIRNDITVTSTGLKVEQAFLLFEDGRLVPSGNKVEVKQ
jgi:hypothetical protein